MDNDGMGFTKDQEATEQKASVLMDDISGSISTVLARCNPSLLLSHHQRVNHYGAYFVKAE